MVRLARINTSYMHLNIGVLWVECSQVEWELVQVDVAGNRTHLAAEASNLVSQHAGSGDLDGIVPVVVVVAKRVREVQDSHLGYL